ncbi:UDP-N-acetylglucosamine 2-epimerase (non-hydrolyzing) [archaeon]|nr:UDP-N-acetylglucosamine 2-epimerase (non-hydrolyzing) [archaeon]
MKIILVVGARPNFMKIAPIVDEVKKRGIEFLLVHTGQHYDDAMSETFFKDLGIPKPNVNLNVGSQSHAKQTAEIMVKFEKVVLGYNPNLVLVVGDVNSTIACALVSAKLGIKVAHVEAGLRSFDRKMPEEINRILTDQISDYLFATEEEAVKNLSNEGIKNNVYLVGNVMIDTLFKNKERAKDREVVSGDFVLLTLHRPSNVDCRERFEEIVCALEELNSKIKVVFPIHPRTRNKAEEFGILERLKALELMGPLGYLDMLNLQMNAKFVLTDSGGLQEETSALGVPCLTLRDNTERPLTVKEGTNKVIGSKKEDILRESYALFNCERKSCGLWDGKAAERIMDVLLGKREVNKVFKAIIFDVDGVLVDTTSYSINCKLRLLKEYGLDLKDYEPVFSNISLKHLVAKVNEEFNVNISAEEFIKKRENMYVEGIKDHIKIFDGVKELFGFLKERKILIGLSTSATKRKLDANLKELDFDFKAIITADDVERQKPDSAQYLLAAEKIKVDPKNCLVVEDSPIGITAAKKAGMFCLGITNSFSKDKLDEADEIIENILEVKRFI